MSSCEKDSVLSDSKVDTRIKNEQGIAEQQFRAILEEYDLNMSFIFFLKYSYKPLTKEEEEHYRAFFRKLSSLQTRAYRWQDDFRISEEGGYWIGSRNAVPHPVPFYCAVYWNSYNWNPYYYSGSYAVNPTSTFPPQNFPVIQHLQFLHIYCGYYKFSNSTELG